MFKKFKAKLEKLNTTGVLMIQVVILIFVLKLFHVEDTAIIIAIICIAAANVYELQEQILRRIEDKS